MINLLPRIEKEKLRSEYRLKLFTVVGIAFTVLLVSAFIPLVISYFAISYNIKFINDASQELAMGEGFQETEAALKTIRDTNRKVSLLNQPTGTTLRKNLVSVFSSIFSMAKNDGVLSVGAIKINGMSYEQIKKKGVVTPDVATTTEGVVRESGIHKVLVRGTAKKREDLLFFLKKLEGEKNFASIDSPVSNLIDSQNIDFNLTITLKDKEI